jgi:hypothetical protein
MDRARVEPPIRASDSAISSSPPPRLTAPATVSQDSAVRNATAGRASSPRTSVTAMPSPATQASLATARNPAPSACPTVD